jgi:hypothetical protein
MEDAYLGIHWKKETDSCATREDLKGHSALFDASGHGSTRREQTP